MLDTNPDVVLLDFHLQDGTGLDAAVAIRRVVPDVRFIFLSRDDSDNALLSAVEAGAEWLIVEQDESAGAPIDDARRSYGALQRMLEEVV